MEPPAAPEAQTDDGGGTMTRLRRRLAFGWRVARAIPRDPSLVPLLLRLAVSRVALVVGCWLAGTTLDAVWQELQHRKRLQLLTGCDAPA
jgi:hypothetical protein